MADAIDRLLATVDGSWQPPPLDAALAEAVLGPSGAPRTPHRRLLEAHNGGYFFERSLHLLGGCADPRWHSLSEWNSPSLWRDTYGSAAEGLVCFGEDAFGDQYAYRPASGGEIVCLSGELGRVETVAPHFLAWVEALVDTPTLLLPLDVMRREAGDGRLLLPGQQLFAYPPLCTLESKTGVTVGHVDAVEAMRFRGALSVQLRDLPPGTRVKIDIE